ncbi:MAG: Na+/H+ antiporter-like protein [candidate division TM6 bacterium GW2011_GWF2_38_10]|nr:MAG: Na+/H+ antiporter-like protein [candidate division TM6 bacterium GW2011_GWF2_38_10]
MQYEFLTLCVPLIVVILASITKNVRVSVGVAIVFAALIATDFSLVGAFQLVLQRFLEVSELSNFASWPRFLGSFNLFICLFLLLLGIIIELIQQSGGAYAYGNFIIDKLKNAKNAQRASLILSLGFGMDDYFSSLTVGSVMRPITDEFRIARVKLGLLVNSLASPLAVLFPLSSWIAQIVGQFRQAGIGTSIKNGILIAHDPFYLYLSVIPFLLYAIIAFFSIWFIVSKGYVHGTLAKHERIAQKTGNLFAGRVLTTRAPRKSSEYFAGARVWDFLLPILLLVGSVVLFNMYCGNDIPLALCKGGGITVLFSCVYLVFRGRIAPKEILGIVWHGSRLMMSSVVVVVFIWTLSALLKDDLQLGSYLAGLIGGRIAIHLLPALFFIAAVTISTMIGSAWGAFGILLPIAIPMLVSLSGVSVPAHIGELSMLLPLLGAIISGSVAGNHLSPIADVMFMSSTSAGAYHLDLVRVMAGFAFPVVLAALGAFLLQGYLLVWGCSLVGAMIVTLLFGIGLNFLIVFLLHVMSIKRYAARNE